jgi:hypothetical protein
LNNRTHLTLVGYTRDDHSKKLEVYLCTCGVTKTIREDSKSKVQDCGCGSALTGQTYFHLTTLKKHKGGIWDFTCQCGAQTRGSLSSVKFGSKKSCGCLNVKSAKICKKETYPQIKSESYRVWSDMLTRCRNPNATSYAYYGGRGITVCDRWKKFENFLEDMGPRPEGMTLDRVDSDGGYSLENCRWVTMQVQNNNRRSNIAVTVNGTTKSLKEWCVLQALPYHRVIQRIRKLNKTVGQALELPATFEISTIKKNTGETFL